MTNRLAPARKFLTKRFSKALLCGGLIGTTALAMAPAAEARHHHRHQQLRRQELRQIRRDLRHDARAYRYGRRAYQRDFNRYPRVIPAYGHGPGYVYGNPAGFGIQLRF